MVQLRITEGFTTVKQIVVIQRVRAANSTSRTSANSSVSFVFWKLIPLLLLFSLPFCYHSDSIRVVLFEEKPQLDLSMVS